MGPTIEAVETDHALPPETEVVVVGGGIIGASAALWLAEAGIPTVLCEKGVLAGEQSSRNWGWCRVTGRDPREVPLVDHAIRLWDGMDRRINGETGFRHSGICYSCETEADVARREQWLNDCARPNGLDTRLLSRAEMAELFPGGRSYAGGLYSASDGRAEPQKAVPAIVASARRKGAIVCEGCAVRGVETTAGRVSAVVTEHGRIRCRTVIYAAGAWTSLLARGAGIRLPQLKVRSSVLRTDPLDGLPETAMWADDFAFRKRLDGGYTIADGHSSVAEITPDSFRFLVDFTPLALMEFRNYKLRLGARFFDEAATWKPTPLDSRSVFESVRILDPEPDRAALQRGLARLTAAFPGFAKARIAQTWAGFIDATPDAVPVISPVEALPGLVIATGFSGHGFGIGPAAGQLAAELATGAPPIVDPAPYRFSRFTDGSRARPIGGL
ncbi:D-amino-acid oxidase [Prosthecomicrobium hirschii]|uniref:NAD(P)/FAD-dependent oxidoreductase n=1 Tax=Prosthecodimorpha hirschii TaxID=665126 RepID=UPI001127482D|nr:FAD-binding oxidoreductase [Prosthecomicrobium hirschii]TPQ48946.1 D-amino-acid oxidase [Prosthecomicrobium hirschii]